VLPLAISLLSALSALLFGARRALFAAACLAFEFALLAVAVILVMRSEAGEVLVHFVGGWAPPFGIVLVIDPLSATMIAICALIFAGASIYMLLEGAEAEMPRQAALFFLLQAGVMGALSTGDLFDFYVFFELMGLSSYALTAYGCKDPELEAAIKFAALSLFGSTLLVMGIGAIYAQTGRLSLASLHEASLVVESRALYLFAVGMLLTALSLKSAIFPLHFWLPDAHSMAPTPVSMVLSGALVNVGAYGIIRVLGSHAMWVWRAAGPVLFTAAAVTAMLMALIAVGQRDIKRLLAYSTASQMGYVITAGALGTMAGIRGALIMLWAHASAKATLFAVAGVGIVATDERRWRKMVGLLRASGWLRAAALCAVMSIAGIPPLAGFTAKLAVFQALVDRGALWALTALLIASGLMVYLMAALWITLAGAGPKSSETAPPWRVAGSKTALISALAAVVVLLGVLGGPVESLARKAAEDLLDGAAYRRAVLPLSEEGKARMMP